MSKNITLQGATYNGVPSVTLPQAGGGTASFVDITGTTATASDVAQGKIFYTADGTETTGTASGGGGGGAIGITDTPDPAGGTIREITAVSLESDTVSPSVLLAGETAHDSTGAAITGTYVPSGGGSAPQKQVNFIDYDGTILHSYTAQEAAALGGLPSNPAHAGLTAQGWNWTLAQIKSYLQAIPGGTVWVGQMYTTASGDTEIDVEFASAARLDPLMNLAVNGTVTVDWGDNTTPDTVTGTSLTVRKQIPHTYAAPGAYKIVIHIVSGSASIYNATNAFLLYKSGTLSNTAETRVYTNAIRAVRIGPNMGLGPYALAMCLSLEYVTLPNTLTTLGADLFYNCYSLKWATIPSSVTTLGNYAFYYAYGLKGVSLPGGLTNMGTYCCAYAASLKHVTIPAGVTTLGNNVFYQCYSLDDVHIPGGVTSIAANAFYDCRALTHIEIPSGLTTLGNAAFEYCYSLAELTIPSGVSTIGTYVFAYCYSLAEIHFTRATPPTLTANALSNMANDRKIYVPAASLETYQTANNWSTYASYMEGE